MLSILDLCGTPGYASAMGRTFLILIHYVKESGQKWQTMHQIFLWEHKVTYKNKGITIFDTGSILKQIY